MTVGAVNGVNGVGYVQPQQKKSGTGKALVGASISAVGGGMLGSVLYDSFRGKSVAEVIPSNVEQKKSLLDKILQKLKKPKTKWALIGAGVAGLLTFVLSKGLSKKMAPAGKAENVKNDPYTNQIITTPSGYKIAVPVMMGSSTHIRPAADGSYVVTYTPTKKGAVTEREVLTEQQLLEKYQHWIVK